MPAVFLRLKGCNLTCGGKTTVQSGVIEEGATWRCDTIEVWTQGSAWTIDALIADWEQKGWMRAFENGAHLIITGGEPLLQQEGLALLLKKLHKRYPSLFVEVETNGTIQPTNTLDIHISQYNVSPKLKNSGLPETSRISERALSFFAQSSKSEFKCVVSSESDLLEIHQNFVVPYQIPRSKITLMPGASSQDDLNKISLAAVEWSKQFGYRFSTRLQLVLWDKATGV